MSWIRKRTPQQQAEAEVLRQWNRSRLQDRLVEFPLELLLNRQCRRLELRAEAARERTDWLPVHRRLWRRTKRTIASASRSSVAFLNRLPFLAPLRRCLVKARRRLLRWLLVRSLHWVSQKYLGLVRTSVNTLMRLSPEQRKLALKPASSRLWPQVFPTTESKSSPLTPVTRAQVKK